MPDVHEFETHLPDPMHEVQDQAGQWVFFERLFDGYSLPLLQLDLGFYKFELTKFMVLELIAASIILAIYIPLARRIRAGGLPKGRFWNAFEGLLVFVRDDIARPNLGGHHHPEEADEYLPFLWTLFLFILVCNLLGMIPLLGSPTASIWVTAGLAAVSFVMLHGAAIVKMGPGTYLKSLWPHIDLGVPYVGILFSLPLFIIELAGTVIKSGVLAVRLFANMFAGHLVLANILLFIQVAGNATFGLWAGVSSVTVFGVVCLSLLELFVAFLQAYVFTFLTALFMGMSLHPEH